MPTSFDEFLSEQRLGPAEETLRLGGTLALDSGEAHAAALCLTATGAFVVAARERFTGRVLAVTPDRMRYELGRWWDRLSIGEQVLSIATGKSAEARRLIARGRLRAAGKAGHATEAPAPDRYVQEVPLEAWEFALGALDNQDALLALVRVQTERVQSELGAEVERHGYFALSLGRAQYLSLSELGDFSERVLAAPAMDTGAGVLSDGDSRWALPPKRVHLLSELVELGRLPANERGLEAARRLWLDLPAKQPPTRVLGLLRALELRGEANATALIWALLTERREPADAAALLAAARAVQSGEPRPSWAELFRGWRFSVRTGREWLLQLGVLGRDAEPLAIELHRALREVSGEAKQADRSEVELDLELAEHELASGDAERARRLARRALATFGIGSDANAGPGTDWPSDADDLGTNEPARPLQRRLYEVLVREAEQRGRTEVAALAALARLDPWSETRTRALARATPSTPEETALVARAEQVLTAVSAGGLDARTAAVPGNATPLPRALLDQFLRHPLARGSGRLATRLSELIAAVPAPDLGFLRDFCEELGSGRYADAERALLRSSALLNLPRVAGYVSHGARSVGLRAFDSGEPFILIGERHLSPESPFLLVGAELDFAVGAELAHLAFGHQRVTTVQIWAGAAGKTRDAISALGLILPVLAEFGSPRTQRLLSKLSSEALQQAAQRASGLQQWLTPPRTPEHAALGSRNEELIAAHRLVQLSADRAGLVAAGDLSAALRAMLLTRADYRELLDAAAHAGLWRALAERRHTSSAFADLLVRVRALVAFYLSHEFDTVARLAGSDGK